VLTCKEIKILELVLGLEVMVELVLVPVAEITTTVCPAVFVVMATNVASVPLPIVVDNPGVSVRTDEPRVTTSGAKVVDSPLVSVKTDEPRVMTSGPKVITGLACGLAVASAFGVACAAGAPGLAFFVAAGLSKPLTVGITPLDAGDSLF
jgi:hypothetical protein